jgi:hypothetical protein
MRLYSGMSQDFISDSVRNQLADKLSAAFFNYYRYKPSPQEANSWRNSLRAVAQLLDHGKLHDQGIILEYQLPVSSKRLDCMVCGRDEAGADQAVIIELKQWERCKPATPEKLVTSWVAGREREVLHPSVQVGQYQQYLEDTHSAFYEGDSPVHLNSCSYLHNYVQVKDDPLLASKFDAVVQRYPVFDADGALLLRDYLRERVARGEGQPVLDRVEKSTYRPSKKLMDHVAATIKGQSPWVLLDEQLVVFEKILSTAASGVDARRKQVIIVHGGPGTGKSVLAINLTAELLRKERNVHYATGSKAFTETLWNALGSRSKALFKYFNSYGRAEYNAVDVLICDESHRIRETSNSRFTRAVHRSDKPQVRELLDAAKVSVFFIDDRQVVRPNEIGSTAHIKQHAEEVGAELAEYELEVQFRCAGSDGFVNWINNTLGVQRTANVMWDGAEGFDLQIVESAPALEAVIRQRASEGNSARVAAGFCWPWSPPRPDGTLVDDVVIGDYRRPWDAKPGDWKLAPGIPTAALWATDPKGIDQIGCVYNIQGFELDYIGVIWGPDLRYDFDGQQWVGDPKASADNVVKRSKEQFVDLVKNTYRVLLSRGLKGCYIYFMDKKTEEFVRSRIEAQSQSSIARAAAPQASKTTRAAPKPTTVLPFKKLSSAEARPYENCVPLIDLKVAAGAFSKEQQVDPTEIQWVELPEDFRPREGLFVAQVMGESMNRRIPSGAWCLFRKSEGGTKQGRVVLAQHREISDADTGARVTVKVYESEKSAEGDAEWHHKRIILKPDTTAPGYAPLTFEGAGLADLDVFAELVAVLG